jgi:hypothetical protein
MIEKALYVCIICIGGSSLPANGSLIRGHLWICPRACPSHKISNSPNGRCTSHTRYATKMAYSRTFLLFYLTRISVDMKNRPTDKIQKVSIRVVWLECEPLHERNAFVGRQTQSPHILGLRRVIVTSTIASSTFKSRKPP